MPSSPTPRTKAPGCTCAASSPEVTRVSLPPLGLSPGFLGCPLNVGVPPDSPPAAEGHLCPCRPRGRDAGRHLLPARQGEWGHRGTPKIICIPPKSHLDTPEYPPKSSGSPKNQLDPPGFHPKSPGYPQNHLNTPGTPPKHQLGTPKNHLDHPKISRAPPKITWIAQNSWAPPQTRPPESPLGLMG